MRLSKNTANRVIRPMVAMTMILSWVWTGVVGAVPKPPPPSKQVQQVDALFATLDQAHKLLNRDTFDVAAVVQSVGKDPDRLFAWVRDRTSWVPYVGALRGPIGVLMDRRGNSLDRALLLAELIRVAGGRARLAHGHLDDDAARALLARVRTTDASAVVAPGDPAGGDVAALAKRSGLDATLVDLDKKGTVFAKALADRVADQAPAVLDFAKKFSALASFEDPLPALRDHWWVEWQNGSEWIAADPTAADAVPRDHPRTALETVAMDRTDGKLPLASQFCHEVTVRVVITRWDGHKLEDRSVLEQVVRPAEMFGHPVATLHHIAQHMPAPDAFLRGTGGAQRFRAALIAETEWQPVLWVGTDQHGKSLFTDGGEVRAVATVGASAVGAGKSALDKIGQAPQAAPGQLVREVVEYEVRIPGRAPHKIRRPIFDLGTTPATQQQRFERGLALSGATEMVFQPAVFSPEYVTGLATRAIQANRRPFLDLVATPAADNADRLKHARTFSPLPSSLLNLASSRFVRSSVRDQVYLDQPNILTYRGVAVTDRSGQVRWYQGFDIVTNDVAVRRGGNALAARVTQGVLDTNLESLLVSADTSVDNTGAAFAAARKAGEPWIAVRSVTDPSWQKVQLPPDVRVGIESDLKDGYAVVAPAHPPTSGPTWWLIHLKTGTTLGMGQHGGGAMAENLGTSVMWGSIIAGSCVLIKGLFLGDLGGARGVGACVALGVAGGFGVAGGLAGTVPGTEAGRLAAAKIAIAAVGGIAAAVAAALAQTPTPPPPGCNSALQSCP